MIIYKITNTVNGKKYYGQTTHSLEKRWKEHLSKLSTNHPLYTAMRKYGTDKFVIEEVRQVGTQEDLDLFEKRYIFLEKTYLRSFGYNLDLGGHGRGKHSEDTKKKISAGLTGKTLSSATKDKIRVASTGNTNMLGKPKSQETKDRISATLSGRVLSQEHKNNISSSMRNR